MANQLGLCKLDSMPLFDLWGTEDASVWLQNPIGRIWALSCWFFFVHQKAGLGFLNVFIFNVELKRKMSVLSLVGRIMLLSAIFWIWAFFIISSKLLIIESQLIADLFLAFFSQCYSKPPGSIKSGFFIFKPSCHQFCRRSKTQATLQTDHTVLLQAAKHNVLLLLVSFCVQITGEFLSLWGMRYFYSWSLLAVPS